VLPPSVPLTGTVALPSVIFVMSHGELRIEPPAQTLDACRAWLAPVREALGNEFLGAYLTGSVLTQGFDPKKSKVNILVVARHLEPDTLDRLAAAIPPAKKKGPGFEPMFVTRRQIEKSVDVFPIEWLDIQERHLRLEGENVFETLVVPRTHLRLQCEHQLRGKNIQLRQTYVLNRSRPAELGRELEAVASTFATLFRTLLRLQGEVPPTNNAQVIERVADVFALDARGLLSAHLVRYSEGAYKGAELVEMYRKFLVEVDRLVAAIDELAVR
jgi:hypothetical protein